MRLLDGVTSDFANSNGTSKLLHTVTRERRCHIHWIVVESIVPLEEDSFTIVHVEVDGGKTDPLPINKVGPFREQLGSEGYVVEIWLWPDCPVGDLQWGGDRMSREPFREMVLRCALEVNKCIGREQDRQ